MGEEEGMHMLQVQWEGKKAIIDLRERILNGEHPRQEVFDFVKDSPDDTTYEIHVPRRAKPLREGLKDLGLTVTLDELAENHFKVIAKKS